MKKNFLVNLIPKYGNWGGRNYSGGNTKPMLEPLDSMDELFTYHDLGYTNNEIYNADKALVLGLKNLSLNPKKWKKPPKSKLIYARIYRIVALLWFLGKVIYAKYNSKRRKRT
jgi:hypothetical protein